MSEVELDDQALFEGAVSDEPEVPATERAAEQPAQGASEDPPATELTDEKPPIPPKPEWRLKEDAEARRAAETALAEERADKAALKQRLEALERANQPAAPKVEKASRPDPLLDPDGYAAAIRQELRDEALADRREESLIKARDSNQAEFDEAYRAAQQSVDPALKARMQASRDPGKTLLEWHRESKARAEVGTDLNAYKAKLREEALKDPEFRKAAMEAWRADAQPQQSNGRPRVELPPSLSGSSRANAALKSSNEEVSDHELFEQITG